MPRRVTAPSFPWVDEYTVVKIGVGGATEKDVLEAPNGTRYIAKLGGRNSDLKVMTEYEIFLIGRTLGLQIAERRIAVSTGNYGEPRAPSHRQVVGRFFRKPGSVAG